METLGSLKSWEEKKIYFAGIGGTGMSSLAGLLKAMGHQVSGSDEGLYSPTKEILQELEISVLETFNAVNIENSDADLFVISNVLSKTNPEVERILDLRRPYTSFAKLLGDYLASKESIVVTGTHGKTTTSALLSHLLTKLDLDPSFFIGGRPKDFQFGFRKGEGALFVVEGDEYDTAFFDKGSKFLHYHPKVLLINNIEFDHADIFGSIDDVKSAFVKLAEMVPSGGVIVANTDDDHVRDVLSKAKLSAELVRVSAYGKRQETEISVANFVRDERGRLKLTLQTRCWGKLELRSELRGDYNVANIALAVGALEGLISSGRLSLDKVPLRNFVEAVSAFTGVQRRLERLMSFQGIDIYEDFGHHPTAIRKVIESFRRDGAHQNKRIIAAFEPRSATARRSILAGDYLKSLALADVALIAPPKQDSRLTPAQRLDHHDLAAKLPIPSWAFGNYKDIDLWCRDELKPNDVVIFFSSGDFCGVQHKLVKFFESREATQHPG